MNNYSFSTPLIDGILSDDYLYFEGIKKPSEYYMLRDSVVFEEKNILILERYLNDIYNLFLRKLSNFISEDTINNEELSKLQALLQELIKVKSLIRNSTKI